MQGKYLVHSVPRAYSQLVLVLFPHLFLLLVLCSGQPDRTGDGSRVIFMTVLADGILLSTCFCTVAMPNSATRVANSGARQVTRLSEVEGQEHTHMRCNFETVRNCLSFPASLGLSSASPGLSSASLGVHTRGKTPVHRERGSASEVQGKKSQRVASTEGLICPT